jgi:hypothetical protein
MTKQMPDRQHLFRHSDFGHSSLIRHSGFVIRHFFTLPVSPNLSPLCHPLFR